MTLVNSDLSALLFAQESALLHDKFTVDLEKLLGDELWEIASDGGIRSRQELCHWLARKSPEASWAIRDFKVMNLDESSALTTYWAKMLAPKRSTSLGAWHSSLWKKNSSGVWQMVFHQSTKVQIPENG